MSSSWFALGAALGVFNILTQWWTVNQVHPRTPHRAATLVIGGAIIRWMLAAGLMAIALQRGIFSGLLVFAGLWLIRWLVLPYPDCTRFAFILRGEKWNR